MSELAKIIDQSDLKFINHLIKVGEIKGLKNKRTDKKIEGFYAALRELTGLSEDISNDELIKNCLLFTANIMGIKWARAENYDEKHLIESVFINYSVKIRKKLIKMSPKQRKKLGNQTEKCINGGKVFLSDKGVDLLKEFKSGNDTRCSLFTYSAFGISALDKTIISIPMSIIKLSKVIGITALFSFIIPVGFLLFALGNIKYIILGKKSRAVVKISIKLIQECCKNQEKEYRKNKRQKLEIEVGSSADISQLMDDLKKFIENKDKTVDEVKDNLWFKRIQKRMEKKNVYIR